MLLIFLCKFRLLTFLLQVKVGDLCVQSSLLCNFFFFCKNYFNLFLFPLIESPRFLFQILLTYSAKDLIGRKKPV